MTEPLTTEEVAEIANEMRRFRRERAAAASGLYDGQYRRLRALDAEQDAYVNCIIATIRQRDEAMTNPLTTEEVAAAAQWIRDWDAGLFDPYPDPPAEFYGLIESQRRLIGTIHQRDEEIKALREALERIAGLIEIHSDPAAAANEADNVAREALSALHQEEEK